MTDTPIPPIAEDHTAKERAAGEAPVLLITAWHLKRMRSMPRSFYYVRKLDFATRQQTGCLWVHRWISRRSLMLTTAWRSEVDARRWLEGDSVARTDAVLRSIDGTVVRFEQYRNGAVATTAPTSSKTSDAR